MYINVIAHVTSSNSCCTRDCLGCTTTYNRWLNLGERSICRQSHFCWMLPPFCAILLCYPSIPPFYATSSTHPSMPPYVLHPSMPHFHTTCSIAPFRAIFSTPPFYATPSVPHFQLHPSIPLFCSTLVTFPVVAFAKTWTTLINWNLANSNNLFKKSFTNMIDDSHQYELSLWLDDLVWHQSE